MSKEIVIYAVFNKNGGHVESHSSLDIALVDIKNRPSTYGNNYTIVKMVGQLPTGPKLMAPALINICGGIGVSGKLYSSEKEAREELHGMVVAWPAVPNKDGYYEVLNAST